MKRCLSVNMSWALRDFLCNFYNIPRWILFMNLPKFVESRIKEGKSQLFPHGFVPLFPPRMGRPGPVESDCKEGAHASGGLGRTLQGHMWVEGAGLWQSPCSFCWEHRQTGSCVLCITGSRLTSWACLVLEIKSIPLFQVVHLSYLLFT